MTPAIAIDIEDIQAASCNINVHRTPVMSCSTLNDLVPLDIELFFKCELFQKTGSFKFRGASNAVNLLTSCESGVVTHSSGNHAQALAKAAQARGIPAYIVMPKNAPQVKKDAVRGYGGTVVECEPTVEAREQTAAKLAEETGATMIHPFDNPHVMAGQGTMALEFLTQMNEQGTVLDALLVPIGGGGMMAGCSTAAKSIHGSIKVFGAEPAQVNDAHRSYYSGDRLSNAKDAVSVADGLLTNVGELTFPIIQKNVDGVFTVTEQEIVRALHLMWVRAKLPIEPSSAVPVAVALYNSDFHKIAKDQGLKKIGIVLSGGNVDHARVVKLFEQYL
ncbi:tryptophan synthase beta subunit-like PLP-dependent enzyme [Hesseltinella vesiculosa]|uniref:Tryptophan synthase beta subunit-like PLP-dependent enzyme n=1 Tax=Hesseltinella vesiculosa TaxID=101127 RepID=A0A1X2GLJ9_9FUNG|nr:tryptophan synthase beta subunit-like PLP-dependent enzyme [Hesseltinella vesiculosa]